MINGGAKTPKVRSAAHKSAALKARSHARASAMSDGNPIDDLANLLSSVTLGRPAVKRTKKASDLQRVREPSMRVRNTPQHLTYSPTEVKKRKPASTSTRVTTSSHRNLTQKQAQLLAHLLSGVKKEERPLVYKSFYAGLKAERQQVDELSNMMARL